MQTQLITMFMPFHHQGIFLDVLGFVKHSVPTMEYLSFKKRFKVCFKVDLILN